MLANASDIRHDGRMDDALAELLDGLSGEEREARRGLLTLLLEQGFTTEQLVAAAREERLVLLPVEKLLSGRYTLAEVVERSGAPAEQIQRLYRLQGLGEPDAGERAFGEGDVAAARAAQQLLAAGLDEEALGDVVRVLGEGMARLSATVTGAVAGSFLRPGDTEEAVALRFVAIANELAPMIGPFLQASFDAHVRETIKRGMIGREELRAGHLPDAQELTVAFADLVGFTALGGEIDALELGTVAGKLAELATDVAEPPVRLVKTIGDAALFVSAEPGPLIGGALRLL
jgi:adenylate cyclase